MKIIGCDFHPRFQQIAMVDIETGEPTEKKLAPAEAIGFYGQLPGPVLVGMEACGNTLWFERLLAQLGHELWMGDAAKVMVARKVAVRLYWMWRNEQPNSATRMRGSPSHPVAEV